MADDVAGRGAVDPGRAASLPDGNDAGSSRATPAPRPRWHQRARESGPGGRPAGRPGVILAGELAVVGGLAPVADQGLAAAAAEDLRLAHRQGAVLLEVGGLVLDPA